MATVKEMMMQDAAASIETSYMMAVGDTFEGTITNMTRLTRRTGSRSNWKRGRPIQIEPFRPSNGRSGEC